MIPSDPLIREYAGLFVEAPPGHESRIAQQDSYWTAFGAAAGEPSRGTSYQHQRIETLLCHCGFLGTLAAAAVPASENSLATGTRAVSFGSGAAFVGNAARTRRADRQYPIFADGGARTQRPSLGLGARAGRARALRRRQSIIFHVGKRPSRAARSRPPLGSRKRTPLAIMSGLIIANVAELVDAPDLGSGGVTRASSSLAFRTTAF